MQVRPSVLVAGVGNIFLGDDGFGPEVARRLTGAPLPDQVRVVDYGIRGMHLAYDLLDGYAALVLVDLVPPRGEPGRVGVLHVTEADLAAMHPGELDAHGMDPAAMLTNLRGMGGRLPHTFVVGCEPLSVQEGIGLSEPVAAAVDEALAQVLALCERLAQTGTDTVLAHLQSGGGR